MDDRRRGLCSLKPFRSVDAYLLLLATAEKLEEGMDSLKYKKGRCSEE